MREGRGYTRVHMANQYRMRGGHGTSLGVLSGRLRGGFTASSLPRSRQSSSSPLPPATNPISPTISSDFSDEGSVRLEENATNNSLLISIGNTLRAVHETVKKLDNRLTSVEQRQIKVTESVKELTSLIKNSERSNFSIKGSTWEMPLREQAAKLFCHSLTREPSDSDIHGSVASVVGRVSMNERHKIQLALKFFKAKLTECRCEERRKVLGHAPYKTSCFVSTRDLAFQIMRQMHAPEDTDEEVYIRHLALFRKFARLSEDDRSATYQTFRQWLGKDRTITEEEWVVIIEEDEAFDYKNCGIGREQSCGETFETIETEIVENDTQNEE